MMAIWTDLRAHEVSVTCKVKQIKKNGEWKLTSDRRSGALHMCYVYLDIMKCVQTE